MGHRMEDMKQMDTRQMYEAVNNRMSTALLLHSDLSDYFNFLGLHGFKRIHEMQYFSESIGKRKLVKKHLDIHNKLLTEGEYERISIIPKDWHSYTRMDIDGGVIPKFVRMAFDIYKRYEKETKEMYEHVVSEFMDRGNISDSMVIKCFLEDTEKELKEVYRLCQQLNGVDYDIVYIMEIQKSMHDELKKKMKKLKVQK